MAHGPRRENLRYVHFQPYTVHMKLTATEFRKQLFAVLEHVRRGETVEVLYKGSAVRLAPSGSSSKLARAKRQNTLRCDPDSIVHSDPKLVRKMEREWRRDWSKI